MPQTGPDLVGAGYPVSNVWTALLGGSTNVSQGNVPARSNLEWFGIASASSSAPQAASGGINVVAVPALPGQVVTNVSILTTATAASVPTHQWAALYAGTGSAPALISQTTDAGSAAVAANSFYKWTYSSPVTLTSSNVPNGFVYVAFSYTASTIPTQTCVTGPATASWYTPVLTNSASSTAPLFFSAIFGSAVGATASSTITSTTAETVVPVVWLT